MSGGGSLSNGGGFLYAGRVGASLGKVGERPFRDSVNVKAYGATGNGTTDDLPAFKLAIAAAKTTGLPVYAPAGDYRLEFSDRYATINGSLILDFEDFEMFGDGMEKSIVHATYQATTPAGRRLSESDKTTPVVQTTSVNVAGASFTVVPASDANLFKNGDNVFFSPNVDGSSPRTSDAGPLTTTVNLPNGITGVVSVSAMNALGPSNAPQNGDYVFIQNKVFLDTPGDYLKFPVGSGLVAAANADGTSPRAPTTGYMPKIVSVDAAANAFSYAIYGGSLTGFVDGDYLFVRPSSALFYTSFDNATLTTGGNENRNQTFRDIWLRNDFHPINEADANAWIETYVVAHAVNPGTTAPSLVKFERCRISDANTGAYLISGPVGSDPVIRYHLKDCETYGCLHTGAIWTDALASLTEVYGLNNSNVELWAENCDFRYTMYSHHWYVHPTVAIWFDRNRFWATFPTHGEGIDHWGQYSIPRYAIVTNNWFGEGVADRAYLTATQGTAYIAGNTFENDYPIGARCAVTVVGNTFRPMRQDSASGAAIITYQLGGHSTPRRVIGNHFDVGQIPPGYTYTCIYQEHPWPLIATGNTVSADQFAPDYQASSASAGPLAIPNTSSVIFALVQSSASILDADSLLSIHDNGIYMAPPAWQPSTVYAVGHRVTNAAQLYYCIQAGTSAASGGPTTTTTNIVDNTVRWECNPTAWAPSTAYVVGDRVANSSRVYVCTVAGTSAASGGPTTKARTVVDGTVTWDYFSAQGTGTAVLAVLQSVPAKLSLKDNFHRAFQGTNNQAVRLLAGPGSGSVLVEGNTIEALSGAGIRSSGAFTGTVDIRMVGNEMKTTNNRGISLEHSGAGVTCEVSRNRIRTSTGDAIHVTASPAAGSVGGEGNDVGTSAIVALTNARRLLPRRGMFATTVAVPAVLLQLDANHDTFRLSDSGAVTVDAIYLGNDILAQRAMDGAVILLVFTTGNITLGTGSGALTAWAASTAYVVGDLRTNASRVYRCITSGTSAGSGGPTTTANDITDNTAHWRYIDEGTALGNITATGGARAAGTVARLMYLADTAKWVEV